VSRQAEKTTLPVPPQPPPPIKPALGPTPRVGGKRTGTPPARGQEDKLNRVATPQPDRTPKHQNTPHHIDQPPRGSATCSADPDAEWVAEALQWGEDNSEGDEEEDNDAFPSNGRPAGRENARRTTTPIKTTGRITVTPATLDTGMTTEELTSRQAAEVAHWTESLMSYMERLFPRFASPAVRERAHTLIGASIQQGDHTFGMNDAVIWGEQFEIAPAAIAADTAALTAAGSLEAAAQQRYVELYDDRLNVRRVQL
jgi:hypothetical protein